MQIGKAEIDPVRLVEASETRRLAEKAGRHTGFIDDATKLLWFVTPRGMGRVETASLPQYRVSIKSSLFIDMQVWFFGYAPETITKADWADDHARLVYDQGTLSLLGMSLSWEHSPLTRDYVLLSGDNILADDARKAISTRFALRKSTWGAGRH